ncbi:hypothetical protein PsorP6_003985 [Peronosclerospora sorghi]|uniref:Uncharacterized protein n=1 Tax=Peronosclerospora sorghi TaxID=230839 RepID=A0ACC0VKG9_9STRA|nr:hypothetical protein PsorP6_003985 [Peronosclerospora sorghi]
MKAPWTIALIKPHRLLVNVGAPASAIHDIDDCCLTANVFIAHKIRLSNQQIAISKILNDMRSRCTDSKGSDEALVVIDFKTKLEPLYFRQKTVEHYGKRGISWHGVMVQSSSNIVKEESLGEHFDNEGENEEETAWLAKEGCEEQEDEDGAEGQSDDDDDKMKQMATENLDPQASTGTATDGGVTNLVLFLSGRQSLLTHATLYLMLLEELYSSIPQEILYFRTGEMTFIAINEGFRILTKAFRSHSSSLPDGMFGPEEAKCMSVSI